MKIAMIHTTESGVSYYRVWQPHKFITEAGVQAFRFTNEDAQLSIEEWARLGLGKQAWVTTMIDDLTGVVLHKGIAMTHNIPWIVDIDDNLFDVSEHSAAWNHYQPGAEGYVAGLMCLQNADAVTVSTEALAKVVRPINKNVYVLPNGLDMDLWGDLKPKKHKGLRIGWQGGHAHYDDLKLLVPVFKEVFERHPEVELHLCGLLPDFFKPFAKNIVYHDGVFIDKWPKYFASLGFDIGLAPLVDRPFNQAKSFIKWMEYSMLGIPTLASNVGPYRDPKNIVLASNKYEWRDRLIELIESPELRKELGAKARAEVIAEHDARNLAQHRIDVYESIIKKKK